MYSENKTTKNKNHIQNSYKYLTHGFQDKYYSVNIS